MSSHGRTAFELFGAPRRVRSRRERNRWLSQVGARQALSAPEGRRTRRLDGEGASEPLGWGAAAAEERLVCPPSCFSQEEAPVLRVRQRPRKMSRLGITGDTASQPSGQQYTEAGAASGDGSEAHDRRLNSRLCTRLYSAVDLAASPDSESAGKTLRPRSPAGLPLPRFDRLVCSP